MFLHASLFALSVPFFSQLPIRNEAVQRRVDVRVVHLNHLFLRPFYCSSVRSFVPPLLWSSVPSSLRSFVRPCLCTFVPLSVRSFVRLSVPLSVSSPVPLSILSSVPPCVRPSVHLSMRPSVGPSLCSFVDSIHRSFVHCNSCVPIQSLVR